MRRWWFFDFFMAFSRDTFFWSSCIKRCQVVIKINIMSSDLIGEYLTFYWADFRLDALLADTMLTKLYTTGP
jgi:hypothetical protein